MAKVEIPYGGQPLKFEVPDENLIEVLSPAHSEPLADLDAEIQKALDAPIAQESLQEWVRSTDRVILISDDNTRLTPSDSIIPPMLDRLNATGIADENISCIMALGTHRYMSREELIAKVGPVVFERIRVFNHEWRDSEALVDLGVSKHCTPLLINRAVVEADVVIGLGAIVPHHIPGFSGSSKIIQPGVSGAGTTAQTHILSCESGGDSFLGVEDNPVRSDMDDIADRVGMSTIFNVVLDSEGRVCGLFFGKMRAAYSRGVALARRIYGVPYHETPDIVLVNSHPCNLDFWQSHKSLYPAQRMIKKGGTIICCTPAPEGVSPVHTELLDFTAWPSEKIKEAYRTGELKNGVACALAIAWAMVREKAEIITVSDGISREDKEALGHIHAPDIGSALQIAFDHQGPAARLTVLTHAPDMLPIYTPSR